jgi:hypothetical protein
MFGSESFDLLLRAPPFIVPAAKITQIKEFTPAAWAKAQEKVVAQVCEGEMRAYNYLRDGIVRTTSIRCSRN